MCIWERKNRHIQRKKARNLWKLGEPASDKKTLRACLLSQELRADSGWDPLRARGSSSQFLTGLLALFTQELKACMSLSRLVDTVVAWCILWAGSVNSPSNLLSLLHIRVRRVKGSLKPGYRCSLSSAEQMQPYAAGRGDVTCVLSSPCKHGGRGMFPRHL